MALALLALEVEEQHESEALETLRDAVKDLQRQLTVSPILCVVFILKEQQNSDMTNTAGVLLEVLTSGFHMCVCNAMVLLGGGGGGVNLYVVWKLLEAC